MKAGDIMTAPVITIGPDTLIRDIAALLLRHRISGVPVVKNDRVVGLVSEGDLLRRHEIGTDRPPPKDWWWARLTQEDPAPGAYVKSHARHARDIMTGDVVSVVESTPIAEIAALLEARGIKRVPVLRRKKLVGIVCRANLIQVLSAHSEPGKIPHTVSDDAIRKQLLAELGGQTWWRTNPSNVIVTDGVVHFWGLLDSDGQKEAARVAAENLPGVRKVEDHRMKSIEWPSMI